MKFRLTVLPRRQIGRAEVQLLRLAVVNVPHLPAHHIGKDEIGRIQDRGAGAEILAEQNSPGLPLRRLGGIRKNPILCQKDGWIRQAEAINGLLHISHCEKTAAIFGNSVKNAVLNLVSVLVFVHHHLAVTGGDGFRQRRGAPLLTQQQAHSVVLLVGKVGCIPPQLLPLICLREGHAQVQQRLHGGRRTAQILPGFHTGGVQDGAEAGSFLFAPVPQGLHFVLQLRKLALSGGGQLWESRNRRRCRVPSCFRRCRQPV